MASPMTLHIGRPCHVRCTPQALDRPFPAPFALGCAKATLRSAPTLAPGVVMGWRWGGGGVETGRRWGGDEVEMRWR